MYDTERSQKNSLKIGCLQINLKRIEARRDKFLMNEVVGNHGLRTVRQKMCSTLEEAVTFVKDDLNLSSAPSKSSMVDYLDKPVMTLNKLLDIDENRGLLGQGTNISRVTESDPKQSSSMSSYCVVKPCRGVASDDVYFCKSLEQVKEAFQKIHQTPIFGSASGARHESVVSWIDQFSFYYFPFLLILTIFPYPFSNKIKSSYKSLQKEQNMLLI